MSFLLSSNSKNANTEFDIDSFKRTRLDLQQQEAWQLTNITHSTPSTNSSSQTISGELSMEENTQKLNQLSLEERNQALHDLHGVPSGVEETPELVVKKLDDFSRCITESKHLSEALLLAIEQSPGYVSSLRLVFLRAERFCVPRAVSRMSNHFESRGRLFGRDSLFRPLRLDDLSVQDREYFEQGGQQILPRRDRSGRAIMFAVGRIISDQPVDTTLRIRLLNLCTAIQDEEIQKRGFILLHYGFGQKKFDAFRTAQYSKDLTAAPIRIEAIHGCYQNPMLSTNIEFAKHFMETVYMCRFRAHCGTTMECNYSLMTFGIPVKDVIPIRDDGTIDLAGHHEWVQTLERLQNSQRGRQASANDNGGYGWTIASCILIPATQDVIMGRGRHGKDMAGNQRFKHLVQEHKADYESKNRSSKRRAVDTVLNALKSYGTRFLKRDEVNGGWIQVSDDDARTKTSHAFRNLRVTPSSNATVTKVRGQKRQAKSNQEQQ